MNIVKRLGISQEDILRIIRSLEPGARGLSDLTDEQKRFLFNYMTGVERLGLTKPQLGVLADVLVVSRAKVGKWPRLSKLQQRLQSEVEEERYDAEMDTLADAYGWAGQD